MGGNLRFKMEIRMGRFKDELIASEEERQSMMQSLVSVEWLNWCEEHDNFYLGDYWTENVVEILALRKIEEMSFYSALSDKDFIRLVQGAIENAGGDECGFCAKNRDS
tara:strand:+ start:226 stop:549 length:324 start_codon:yes stop_codon:yes gene_type:complete